MSEPWTSTPHRPPLIRLVNAVGRGLARLGWQSDLTVESISRAATRRAGLSDFGDDRYAEGLRVLLAAMDQEARLNPLGRLAVRTMITDLLVGRLEMGRDYAVDPEIARIPIERPIVIAGLYRTGTTLLHRLLATHPSLRALRTWELQYPSPPPDPTRAGPDPRVAQAARAHHRWHSLIPGFAAVHLGGPEDAEECNELLQRDFRSLVFELVAHVPSYGRWLRGQDMVPTYRYYRRQLQHYQRHSPARRLVLKAPAHLFALGALLEVFPDAIIIQTHRALDQALPSLCSLSATTQALMSDQVDLAEIGRYWLDRAAEGLDHAIAAREAAPKATVIDVAYGELVADPPAVVARICASAGLPRVDCSMEAARSSKPNRAHRYSLAQFSLRVPEIERRFAGYLDRFEAARPASQ